MKIGDMVKVDPPFDTLYPGVYPIVGTNPDTGSWKIQVDPDAAIDECPDYAASNLRLHVEE